MADVLQQATGIANTRWRRDLIVDYLQSIHAQQWERADRLSAEIRQDRQLHEWMSEAVYEWCLRRFVEAAESRALSQIQEQQLRPAQGLLLLAHMSMAIMMLKADFVGLERSSPDTIPFLKTAMEVLKRHRFGERWPWSREEMTADLARLTEEGEVSR